MILKVDILLATYNGELYIRELLESLISQTYKDINVIISDDGSTDSTVDIIDEYKNVYDFINLVNINKQGGVVKNFNKALSFSKSNYIMFCDQDDVWFPEKIERSLNAIVSYEKEQPGVGVLIFTDLELVDEKLSTLNNSFYLSSKLNPEYNLDYRYLHWRSTVYGCTCIFNKALIKISDRVPTDFPMHDHYYALLAATYGLIGYLDEPTIYYRQHKKNVVGGASKSSFKKLLNFHALLKSMGTVQKKTISINNHFGSMDLNLFSHRLSFVRAYIKPFYSERPLSYFIFIFMLLFVRGL